jgi:F0F1-type ATP synthase epsilon subunit
MANDSAGSSTYGAAYQASAETKKNKQQRFQVKIFSPYQTYYEGVAVSLSAANRTGPFDVLSGHINFFSLLSSGKVIINTGYQILEFEISRGILRVNGNEVTLFADV